MCGATRDVRFVPITDIGFRGRQIKCYVVCSTPNLSDLIIDCAGKFLRYALNLLPRICTILAFEHEDIDYPNQAKEKDKTKEKFAHA